MSGVPRRPGEGRTQQACVLNAGGAYVTVRDTDRPHAPLLDGRTQIDQSISGQDVDHLASRGKPARSRREMLGGSPRALDDEQTDGRALPRLALDRLSLLCPRACRRSVLEPSAYGTPCAGLKLAQGNQSSHADDTRSFTPDPRSTLRQNGIRVVEPSDEGPVADFIGGWVQEQRRSERHLHRNGHGGRSWRG